MYKLLKQEGSARRAEFTTNRGTVQTPAFMNVATAAAIKGAVSAGDLKTLGCQIMLSNTYHLHVRVFACKPAPYNRRGGYLCFTCGRQTYLYGS